MEPVGVHPRLDVIDAVKHSLHEFQCRVRTTVAVNLPIVRIEMAAKTTTLNHGKQVGGVVASEWPGRLAV